MPPFPKPRFAYDYYLNRELAAIRAYRRQKPGRQIPKKAGGRLLVATWNIANLGVQDRLDTDYALIAEMIGWFDLAAVQEVNDDLRGIEAIHSKLPARYDLLFSDASGNQERQAFLYDTRKVARLKEVGRLSIPPSQLGNIKLPGTTTAFPGFDRGPYLATFRLRLLPVLAAERPPVLRLARSCRRRPAHAGDLRGRVVGGPEAPGRTLVRAGDRPAGRLQPPQVRARRQDLRRARPPRPRGPAAHLADRLGDRLGLLLRPDRVLSPARQRPASPARAMSSTSTAPSSRACGNSAPEVHS